MRERNRDHNLAPVLEHYNRPNNSVDARRSRKGRNAQKSGVFAEPLVLPGEDPREFEAIHAALIAEWNPSGPSEESRIFGMADAEWRKLRSRRFAQAKAISNSLNPKHPAFDQARALITFGYLMCRNQKLRSPNTRAHTSEPTKSAI
jgi:alkanesulfonate monooxygenase SsuD/methylene tetrahydromethanopterin reductase-like flavin-dependent oxidoreductase (luciferase family)